MIKQNTTQIIPIWEKYTLSIEEAAAYFRIGQTRIRQIVAENPNADFVLAVGNRIQIKRKQFEHYIDLANVV
ncbi:MAG: excisionase [Lachnospiraceae bacterium]|nr:excisionase [Lachnospiraceae bacterium]